MRIFVIVFLVLLIILLLPFLVKVRTQCNIQTDICPKIKYESLYLAKRDAKRSLDKNSRVLSYSLQFKLPNILLINLVTKQPYFAVKDAETNKVNILDKDGTFLYQTENTTLPMVIQKGTSPNIFSLNIISGVKSMFGVSVGEIKNDSLVVDLPGGLRVLFPLEGEADILLGSLRLIYSKITTPELSGKYSQVDLRFHNPILR